MNILFIHPSCPGQFEHLIRELAKDTTLKIVFLCKNVYKPISSAVMIKNYRADTDNKTPFEECTKEAEAVFWAIKALEKEDDFKPDIVVGHSGWGSLLYIRAACPTARVVGYFEWYFCMLPEFKGAWFIGRSPEEISVIITQRNAAVLAQLEECDTVFTPTKWQQERFPDIYIPHIKVIHEGIDTGFFSPYNKVNKKLTEIVPETENAVDIITFSTRGLEPTRCFPLFMTVVRLLLKNNPDCHIVIAGNDKTYYGSQPSGEKSWLEQEIDKGGYDTARVHFPGWITKEDFLALLQASTVHVYLTLPFVLSWSLMQAMSTECCVVASDVGPVREVVEDNVNGLLVSNLSPEGIVSRIEEALYDANLRKRLGKKARETITDHYTIQKCVEEQKHIIF